MRPEWTIARRAVHGKAYVVVVDAGSPDPVQQGLLSDPDGFADSFTFLFSQMRPGMVVLDIGAHVGTFSLPACALGCRVIAVEASAHNVEKLRQSALENRFSQLQVVHAAVSDHAGMLTFLQANAWGHVVADDRAAAADVEQVRAVTVDDLLEELGIQHVDIIKMDVEGSEVAAFRGMRRLAEQQPAPLIMFEDNPAALAGQGETHRSLMEAVIALGYQPHLIERRGLRLYHAEDPLMWVVSDFAAVKPAERISAFTGRRRVLPRPTDADLVQQVIEESAYIADSTHRRFLQRALDELNQPGVLTDPRVVPIIAKIHLIDEAGSGSGAAVGSALDAALENWNAHFELRPTGHASRIGAGAAFLGRTLRRIRRLGHAQTAGSAYLADVNDHIARLSDENLALRRTLTELQAELAQVRARLDSPSDDPRTVKASQSASTAAFRQEADDEEPVQ